MPEQPKSIHVSHQTADEFRSSVDVWRRAKLKTLTGGLLSAIDERCAKFATANSETARIGMMRGEITGQFEWLTDFGPPVAEAIREWLPVEGESWALDGLPRSEVVRALEIVREQAEFFETGLRACQLLLNPSLLKQCKEPDLLSAPLYFALADPVCRQELDYCMEVIPEIKLGAGAALVRYSEIRSHFELNRRAPMEVILSPLPALQLRGFEHALILLSAGIERLRKESQDPISALNGKIVLRLAESAMIDVKAASSKTPIGVPANSPPRPLSHSSPIPPPPEQVSPISRGIALIVDATKTGKQVRQKDIATAAGFDRTQFHRNPQLKAVWNVYQGHRNRSLLRGTKDANGNVDAVLDDD